MGPFAKLFMSVLYKRIESFSDLRNLRAVT